MLDHAPFVKREGMKSPVNTSVSGLGVREIDEGQMEYISIVKDV